MWVHSQVHSHFLLLLLGITNSCQLYRSSPSTASGISEPEVQLVFKIQKVLLYVWPQQKILFKVPQVQKFLLEMVGLEGQCPLDCLHSLCLSKVFLLTGLGDGAIGLGDAINLAIGGGGGGGERLCDGWKVMGRLPWILDFSPLSCPGLSGQL